MKKVIATVFTTIAVLYGLGLLHPDFQDRIQVVVQQVQLIVQQLQDMQPPQAPPEAPQIPMEHNDWFKRPQP